MQEEQTRQLTYLQYLLVMRGTGLRVAGVCLFSALAFFGYVAVAPPPAIGLSSGVVISQIYGGGGSSSSSFKNDYVELFNRGAAAVNLTGWSLQYASATGISWDRVELSGSIGPGQYYLIKLAAGSSGTKELPAPDADGPLQISATAGKVALVNNRNFLDGTLACPAGFAGAGIVDFVGYGGIANCYEGRAPAPAIGNVSATIRRDGGCAETDNNGADFTTGPPNPRNGAKLPNSCGATITAQADLVVTTQITQPATGGVAPDGMVSFTVEVFNAGLADAANVIVSFLLPAGFANIGADQGGQILGGSVSWPAVQRLNAGGLTTFSVTASAPQVAGKYVGRAVANADIFDPIPGNNTSLREVLVIAGAMFDESSVRVFIKDTGICSTIYTVTVKLTNLGATPQLDNTEAEYYALVSPEAVFTGSCFATQGQCRGNSGGNNVRWDGDIDVGDTVTITYNIQVVALPDPVEQVKFCVESKVSFDSDNSGGNESEVAVKKCAGYACSPGEPVEPRLPSESPLSDQKAGSILIFNLYTSSSSDPARADTRINITNTSIDENATVHLFFVSGDTCGVSDTYTCLTANQTFSFMASDLDPGVTGYLVAVAVDGRTGCPIKFNYLIGDEYVRLQSNHAANLGAEAFAAVAETPCACDDTVTTADLLLDDLRYNRAPQTLAVSNLLSLADGNSTLLVINSVGGDLLTGVENNGVLSGLLFDDAESVYSFSTPYGCQLRQLLSNAFPRTAPRFAQVIPGGRTGWMKLSAQGGAAILGSVLVANPSAKTAANAFSGGRNLHKLRFADGATFRVPIFPAVC